MSKIKQLLEQSPEDIMATVNDTDASGCYPGQALHEREQAELQWELSKYSDQDLHDEINRRLFEPFNKSMAEFKTAIDKFTGYTDERPF